MYFSPQSPALHCSICPRDSFSSQVQTVFTHRSFPTHSLVFRGPFPLYGDVEWPLCSFTMLIPSFSLCFSIFLCPSFPHSFLYIQLFFITVFYSPWLCRKNILSIGFENSFTPQSNWLIFIMRVPFPNCSHSLLIVSSGFVTEKFSILGWFWSAYGFAVLTFVYFFLDFLLPHDIIFFFLPFPKLHLIFLFSSVVLFSLFKVNFVIDLDTLLIFTSSTEV